LVDNEFSDFVSRLNYIVLECGGCNEIHFGFIQALIFDHELDWTFELWKNRAVKLKWAEKLVPEFANIVWMF
jgi:hypothetical protein